MQEPSQRLPILTLLFILANLLVAVFTLGSPEAFEKWGFIPKPLHVPTVTERIITIFTCQFIHINTLHLLANMIFLAAVGPRIEEKAGWFRFLIVYIVGGACGVLLHWAFVIFAMPTQASSPLLGASAPVSALIGFYLIRFYNDKVPIAPRVYIPIYVVVLFWLILQSIGAFLAIQQFGAPIAFMAHLGAFLVGLILAFILGAGKEAVSEAYHQTLESANRSGLFLRIASLKSALKKRPNDLELLRSLSDALVSANQTEEACSIALQMFRLDATFQEGYAIKLLCTYDQAKLIPQEERLKIAESLSNTHSDLSEKLVESIIEESPDAYTADALFLMIRLTAATDLISAKVAAKKLDTDYKLSYQTESARKRWPELFKE